MEVNQNPMGNKSDDKPEPSFERSSESRRQHGQMILPSLGNTKKHGGFDRPGLHDGGRREKSNESMPMALNAGRPEPSETRGQYLHLADRKFYRRPPVSEIQQL